MFSIYKKIVINNLSEVNIVDSLNNINDDAIIMYNKPLVNKYLFRKGFEGINFISKDILNIIKIGKPDLIITGSYLESSINDFCKKKKITIFNYKDRIGTCGRCGKQTVYLNNQKIEKICSEECSLIEHPEIFNIIKEQYSSDPDFVNDSKNQDSNLIKSFSNKKESRSQLFKKR